MRFPRSWALFTGAALCLLRALLIPSVASAAHVLVVSDSGADLNLADALRADGHTVEVSYPEFMSGNATLRSDLSGYDAVFWSASGSGSGDVHPDASVFSNLVRYVEAGGRVLVTGYDSVASPEDPLLIQFLGGTGSTDVPPAPGPITMESTSLTVGVVDIRGLTPMPTSGDRDTLTGLGADTLEVVGTPTGNGAQWTLRRLGRGEIAYVSNGNSSESEASWTDTSSAYNAAIRNFAASTRPFAHLVSETSPVPGRAHPRRAHTTSLLGGDHPAVLVASDRAWVPSIEVTPIALCGASRCRPVRAVESCSPPACPGYGQLVIAVEPVADVAPYPGGRDAWNRETSSLVEDGELATLRGSFGTHPEPSASGDAMSFRGRDELTLEGSVQGGIGYLAHRGVAVGTATASLGLRWSPRMDEPFRLLFGSTLGLDARVTLVPGVTGQRPEDVGVLLGIAPASFYAFDRVRLSPTWAWVIPEVGVALRPDRSEAVYLAWSVAGAVLLDPHLGLEARASATIIDDWADAEAIEALLSLSLGVIFR